MPLAQDALRDPSVRSGATDIVWLHDRPEDIGFHQVKSMDSQEVELRPRMLAESDRLHHTRSLTHPSSRGQASLATPSEPRPSLRAGWRR